MRSRTIVHEKTRTNYNEALSKVCDVFDRNAYMNIIGRVSGCIERGAITARQDGAARHTQCDTSDTDDIDDDDEQQCDDADDECQ